MQNCPCPALNATQPFTVCMVGMYGLADAPIVRDWASRHDTSQRVLVAPLMTTWHSIKLRGLTCTYHLARHC